jgi:V8-like Glu-specific endopeptidase
LYYWRYDCATGEKTEYLLEELPSTQVQTRGYSVEENRVIDTDQSVVRLSNGGSGFIISDHCIATAAHCLYNRSKARFSTITVTICDNNYDSPIETLTPSSLHVPDNFISYSNEYQYSCYDYGLIYVEEDLSQYGAFNLGVPTAKFLAYENEVTASGFPGKINGNQPSNHYRYKSDGIISFFTKNVNQFGRSIDLRFSSSCCTSGGDSGGPLYKTTTFQGTEYRTVVGIVTGGTCEEEDGVYTYTGTYGVRITTDLLHFFLNNDYL